MELSGSDTIYALSSGSPPCGVAVIRISGPLAGEALLRLCGGVTAPRKAVFSTFRDDSGAILDRGLALWCPAPASYTGEDVAEIHTHGSTAVIEALFDSLAKVGLRPGEPGEFTRRAFRSGKLDLTEVEGLSDLLAAETEMQRRQAVAQAGGFLANVADGWRNRLIAARADYEARIDFSDEGDVSAQAPRELLAEIASLSREMRDACLSSRRGERIRSGFRVALLGRPNAGKSSLINAIAGRDVAIVTAEPGTTRDVLEVRLDLDGCPVLVFDTAGLRESASVAEAEGVRRAMIAATEADLVLWLEDVLVDASDDRPHLADVPCWRVRTKLDLAPAGTGPGFGVSVVTGEGMETLMNELGKVAAETLDSGPALVTRQRQRDAIARAVAALEQIPGAGDEIAADLLRLASDSIGRLVGRVDVEDVLERIFQEFCIGK